MTIFVVWHVDCLRIPAAKLAKIFNMHRILKCLAVLLLFFSVGGLKAFAQYDKDVFYMRGRNALAEGKYAQAIDNFNVLAQLDTADYYTFFFRGIAKYNLGDLRGAISTGQSALIPYSLPDIITEASQKAVSAITMLLLLTCRQR